jgi:cation:H+ antiporter
MGVTLLLGLRFQRWAAWALLGLFVVQFPLTSTDGRLALSGVYAVIALVALIRYRRDLLPTLSAPFAGRAKRHGGHPHPQPEQAHSQ